MSNIDKVLTELSEFAEGKRPLPPGCREPMREIGPEGGRLIQTLVGAVHAKRGLEIGTSSGWSALFAMKGALPEFYLTTIDYDPVKADWARANFERAGVADRIAIVVSDALEAVKRHSGPLDYLLLDAAKSQTLPILKHLLPFLTVGAVVLTDNINTHADELKEFVTFVRGHKELASACFNVGHGIEVTIKLA